MFNFIRYSISTALTVILFSLQINCVFCINNKDTNNENVDQCGYILKANTQSSSASIDSVSDNTYKTYVWQCSNNKIKSKFNDINFCDGIKEDKESITNDKIFSSDQDINKNSGTSDEMNPAKKHEGNAQNERKVHKEDRMHQNKMILQDAKTLNTGNLQPEKIEINEDSNKKNNGKSIVYGEVDYSDMDIEDYSISSAKYGSDRYIAPFGMMSLVATENDVHFKSKDHSKRLEKESGKKQKILKSKIPILDVNKKSKNKRGELKKTGHRSKQAPVNSKKVKKQKYENNLKRGKEKTHLKYPANIIADGDLFDTWIDLKISLRRKPYRNRIYYYGAMEQMPSYKRYRRIMLDEALETRSLVSSGDDMCKIFREFADLEKVNVVDRITQYVSNSEQKLPLAEGILK